MKKLLALALSFVALAVLTGLAVGQGTQQKKISPSQAQKICSQAKMQLLGRLRAIEACVKAEKQGRVNEAKKRRAAGNPSRAQRHQRPARVLLAPGLHHRPGRPDRGAGPGRGLMTA